MQLEPGEATKKLTVAHGGRHNIMLIQDPVGPVGPLMQLDPGGGEGLAWDGIAISC